jgi:hypothetical protein
MAIRFWGIVILATTSLTQPPFVHGADAQVPNGSSAPVQTQAAQFNSTWQTQGTLLGQNSPGADTGSLPSTFMPSVSSQWPLALGRQPSSLVQPTQTSAGANAIVRLPPTAPANPSGAPALTPRGAPEGFDGTYRDDGEYVTINIDGKEMKLLKPRAALAAMPSTTRPEGTVRGRLMENGRPLINCRVVIVPLEGDGKTYRYDANREPLSSATDNQGIYYFEHVPIGKYKLTWLPDGTNQWIRRIAIKPDLFVRSNGETVSVNTIGAARHTIN